MSDIKSVRFKSTLPEDCWRQYQDARLSPGFDDAHYPELDHFWYREDTVMGVKQYILVVIYGRDLAPNM